MQIRISGCKPLVALGRRALELLTDRTGLSVF